MDLVYKGCGGNIIGSGRCCTPAGQTKETELFCLHVDASCRDQGAKERNVGSATHLGGAGAWDFLSNNYSSTFKPKPEPLLMMNLVVGETGMHYHRWSTAAQEQPHA